MTAEQVSRSRRAVLTAAVAGLAGWVANAVKPAQVADAADGGPMLLGSVNDATSPTYLHGYFEASKGIRGEDQLNINGVGVTGFGPYRGMHAHSDTGWALYADGTDQAALTMEAHNTHATGEGVLGENTHDGVGLHGRVMSGVSPDSAGVWGEGWKRGVQGNAINGGIGVAGAVQPNAGYGSPRIQNGPANAGVYGWNVAQGAADAGVAGLVNNGNGVIGLGTFGTGVYGQTGADGSTWPAAKAGAGVYGVSSSSATGSKGVWGHATHGIGVYCTAGTGPALQVVGKSKFSRAGKASVAAGKNYVDVSVPGGIASNTLVFATLLTYRAGVAIATVRHNYPSTGKARIYLTKVASTSTATSIGWMAIEYGS